MAGPHISLAAEKIGSIGGLPITNSILTTWLVMGCLIVFSLAATKKVTLIPHTIQLIAEMVVEGLHNLFKSVVGSEYITPFFPLLSTIFLFVLVANWSGLLPGVGSIGLFKNGQVSLRGFNLTQALASEEKTESAHEATFVPLFRGPTADLNTTLALALIAVFMIQFYGIKALGLGYFKKFFNFSNPIMFGIGLLEIVSEFSRIISFAFRLFGNIFAGEVLLTVIAFLMPLIAPLPFLGLELFVGVVQALVFSMLTAVFLNMATTAHAEH